MTAKHENDRKENFKIFYSLDLAARLGFSIAIPLVVFILAGRFLDGYFNTFPIFVLAGIIFGFIVSIYEIFRSVLPVLDDKKSDSKKNGR